MTEHAYRINLRQMRRMTILEIGVFGSMLVTLLSGKETGLFSVIAALVGGLLYALLFVGIGRTDGGYYAMVERSLPSFAWRLLWIIYSIRFALHSTWYLSFLVHLIHETLYSYEQWFILIPLMLICIYAGRRSMTEHARYAELLFWWIILPLAAVYVIGLWNTDLSVSNTVEDSAFTHILQDEYHIMPLFLPAEFLLFRVSALQDSNRKICISTVSALGLSGLCCLLVYLVTIGILGTNWAHVNLLGVTDAMEQIIPREIPFERLDILLILFWLISGSFALSSYMFFGQQSLQRAFSTGNHPNVGWEVLMQAGLVIACYTIFPSADAWTQAYINYACYLDIPFSVGIPLLILCIYRYRMHIHPHHVNTGIKLRHTTKYMLLLCLLILTGTLSGCMRSDSIEERAYVKELHIKNVGEQYEFRCVLSYISHDALSDDITVIATNSKSGNSDQADSTTFYEFAATANNIHDFNEFFKQRTDCTFDYSHLQGIYLASDLQNADPTYSLLSDIRTDTKAVLSTPVYTEDIEIGNQPELTLGDYIKYFFNTSTLSVLSQGRSISVLPKCPYAAVCL